LCKRAHILHYIVQAGYFQEGTGATTRNPHRVEAIQVRHVCKECNSGWMNDLEAWFEHRLGRLIEPTWPTNAASAIEALMPEGEMLARWLLKTAITCSLSSMQQGDPVIFSPEVTRRAKDGLLPDSCWVDLAHSARASPFRMFLRKGFRVIDGSGEPTNKVLTAGDGFRFVVQFNHLLLCIARAPAATVTFQSWAGELPVHIFPTTRPLIEAAFTYDNLQSFEDGVVLET
jgi:hypothetical protein